MKFYLLLILTLSCPTLHAMKGFGPGRKLFTAEQSQIIAQWSMLYESPKEYRDDIIRGFLNTHWGRFQDIRDLIDSKTWGSTLFDSLVFHKCIQSKKDSLYHLFKYDLKVNTATFDFIHGASLLAPLDPKADAWIQMHLQSSPYTILEIAPDATSGDIKNAYKKLALIWHPDRHTDPDQYAVAQQKFPVIQEAYELLKDTQARDSYDKSGHNPRKFAPQHIPGDKEFKPTSQKGGLLVSTLIICSGILAASYYYLNYYKMNKLSTADNTLDVNAS